MSDAEFRRTFICFDISPALREYLAALIAKAQAFGEKIGWARPAQIHLTLKFLGQTSARQLTQVSDLLAELAAHQTRLHFAIDTLGAFPNWKRPRVLWAGSSTTPAVLTSFIETLENRLHLAGFAREARPFSPHLTIGRVRGGAVPKTVDFLSKFTFQAHSLTGEQIVFMQSELTPRGAIYTPIQKFQLLRAEGGE